MVRDRAALGTSESDAKHPSETCWRRQASSSSTTRTSDESSKSHDRRIDEREVAVLADAQDRETWALLGQQGRVAGALGRLARSPSVEAVEGTDRDVIEEAIHEEPPERGRVPGVHARVLVEMEGGDLPPGHVGVGAQGGQELVLGGSGREDHGRAAIPLHEATHVGRDRARRCASQARAVLMDLDA